MFYWGLAWQVPLHATGVLPEARDREVRFPGFAEPGSNQEELPARSSHLIRLRFQCPVTALTRERPYGSVRGAISDDRPYRVHVDYLIKGCMVTRLPTIGRWRNMHRQ
jgi:hypothetical protein